MERLTVKQVIQNERKCVERQQCDRNCAKCDIVMDANDILSAYDHVLELLDAEDQGLLVRLPCKVGDTVYIHWFEYDNVEVVEKPFSYGMIPYMGVTVFLSREEAEAALEKEGGELCTRTSG